MAVFKCCLCFHDVTYLSNIMNACDAYLSYFSVKRDVSANSLPQATFIFISELLLLLLLSIKSFKCTVQSTLIQVYVNNVNDNKLTVWVKYLQ